jgi:hypothetical protein
MRTYRKHEYENQTGHVDTGTIGSTGVVDRGVGLRISRQYLSSALVCGRGIVFRHHYRSLAKSAGKDFRDGAVVPFE